MPRSVRPFSPCDLQGSREFAVTRKLFARLQLRAMESDRSRRLIFEMVGARAPVRAKPRVAVARAVNVGAHKHLVAGDTAIEVGDFVNREGRGEREPAPVGFGLVKR